MAINLEKLVIDRIGRVSLQNKTDGSLMFLMDQIKDGSITNGAEQVFGSGAAGVRIIALNRNKTAGFECNNGFVSGGALAAQLGGEPDVAEDGSLVSPYFDQKTVAGTGTDMTAVTEHTAEGLVGDEIGKVYVMVEGNPLGKELVQDKTLAAGKFTYDPETKKINVSDADAKTGDLLTMVYNYKTSGAKILNSSDNFPKSGKLLVEVLMRDVCDNETIYTGVMVFPNAAIDGNFTMTFGNEPMVHNFKATALLDVCSASKELWYLIIPTE